MHTVKVFQTVSTYHVSLIKLMIVSFFMKGSQETGIHIINLLILDPESPSFSLSTFKGEKRTATVQIDLEVS